MPYRVIQWSTGNVGRFALRAILGHPELELVGLWVSGAKAGKDAGELCGLPAAGVRATSDADALLAPDGWALLYAPGSPTDPDLARWRNALWPWLHVGAIYRTSDGRTIRETLQGVGALATPAARDGVRRQRQRGPRRWKKTSCWRIRPRSSRAR